MQLMVVALVSLHYPMIKIRASKSFSPLKVNVASTKTGHLKFQQMHPLGKLYLLGPGSTRLEIAKCI